MRPAAWRALARFFLRGSVVEHVGHYSDAFVALRSTGLVAFGRGADGREVAMLLDGERAAAALVRGSK